MDDLLTDQTFHLTPFSSTKSRTAMRRPPG
jgi:hypothetical protein